MRLFRPLFWFILLLFCLQGCVNTKKVHEPEQEALLAVSLSEDERYLYVIGKLHDYQFDGQKIRNGEDLARFKALVTSRFADRNGGMQIRAIEYNEKEVVFWITIYLNAKGLSGKDFAEFRQHIYNPEHKSGGGGGYYASHYQFIGERVKVANREHILAQGRLASPVEFALSRVSTGKAVDTELIYGVGDIVFYPVKMVAKGLFFPLKMIARAVIE